MLFPNTKLLLKYVKQQGQAVLDYLEGHDLFWRAGGVDSFGVNFVKVLCYIDGHHDTFNIW